MELVRLPIERLRPAPYNPRQPLDRHPNRLRKLKRSLSRFGLVEPLVWNRVTGHVVGGHQRLELLRAMGINEVPVSVVELTLEQEKALNVVLNNREAQSDWDMPRLRDLLTELASTPEPMLRETGFDPSHLEQIRQQLEPAAPPVPEGSTEPQWVEIVLRVPVAELETVRAACDPVVDKLGLECHFRWR
ncbi:MAG TPA: ParB N-terminal domain-containing protein [Gemmatales bacterium]|nr:ParB N-terminal domain-containing protein [Gemmatales bacterium]HMP60957.1 ParB N-terminal domain-containing protein [Gemmatales bacterium]